MSDCQTCQCGAQAGYLHAPDCPYPLFRDDRKQVETWIDARDRLRFAEPDPSHVESSEEFDTEVEAAYRRRNAVEEQATNARALEREQEGEPGQ